MSHKKNRKGVKTSKKKHDKKHDYDITPIHKKNRISKAIRIHTPIVGNASSLKHA